MRSSLLVAFFTMTIVNAAFPPFIMICQPGQLDVYYQKIHDQGESGNECIDCTSFLKHAATNDILLGAAFIINLLFVRMMMMISYTLVLAE